MNYQLFHTVVYLFAVLLGGLSIYYKSNVMLRQRAIELIAQAEVEYKHLENGGEQKFAWVVDQLYTWIPAAIRLFIPRSMISRLVQTTFDSIDQYTKIQMDQLVQKVVEQLKP